MKNVIVCFLFLSINVYCFGQSLPMFVIDSSVIAQKGLHPELERYVRNKIGITDSLVVPERLKKLNNPKNFELKGRHEYYFQSLGQTDLTEIVFVKIEKAEIINWLISILIQIDNVNPFLIEQLEDTKCVFIPINESGCCAFEINERDKKITLSVAD